MNLTPAQRDDLYIRYNGRCAYCGNRLEKKWHADHVRPVQRDGNWIRTGKRYEYVANGTQRFPDRDNFANLEPACVPCNIHKSDMDLESWRKLLERSAATLERNYSTYRHALRFRLVVPAPPKVTFYFERFNNPPRRT